MKGKYGVYSSNTIITLFTERRQIKEKTPFSIELVFFLSAKIIGQR